MDAARSETPEIDYLAKDFESFRGLLLDHLHLQLPEWTERNTADLGVTLVELMAYVGDSLSYYQDAVAAEAYLSTCRQRVSARRHARLLDYAISEGCNARVLVQFQTVADGVQVPQQTQLLPRILDEGVVIATDRVRNLEGMDERSIFETMHMVTLYRDSNAMAVEAAGPSEFDMRGGRTAARLSGRLPHLAAGDLLVLVAVNSRGDAVAAPHPVRLSEAPVFALSEQGRPVTTVRWFAEDALPQDLAPESREGGYRYIALGNIALADSGATVTQEWLAQPREAESYAPRLSQRGLVHAAPVVMTELLRMPAARSLSQQPAEVLPSITLQEFHRAPGDAADPLLVRSWQARRDLLGASRFEPVFTVEIDDYGHATLRFLQNDSGSGMAYVPRYAMRATYRVQGATSALIAAGALQHAVGDHLRIVGVTNPIAAQGELPQEALEHIRQNAPQAFRKPKRCVTEDDYAARTRMFDGVRTAHARRLGVAVRIDVERVLSPVPDDTFLADLQAFVAAWALLGDVVEIILTPAAKSVPMRVEAFA